MGVHVGATWRIRLNCQCAVAIQPYVKLLRAFDIIIANNSLLLILWMMSCFYIMGDVANYSLCLSRWRHLLHTAKSAVIDCLVVNYFKL